MKKTKNFLNCDFIEYDLLTLTEIESEPFDYALDPANGGKRWQRN